MKFFAIAAVMTAALCLTTAVSAQKPDEILATSTGHKYTLNDLSPEIREQAANMPALIKKARTAVLDEMLSSRALQLEAAAQNLTPGKLIANTRAKVPAPSEAEIKAVYDKNKDSLGDATLEQLRERIVAFLRGPAEQKAVQDLAIALRTKYKAAAGKDVNSPNLAATDVVGTVGGQPITTAQYDRFSAFELYTVKADISDQILNDLDDTIFNTIVADEARSLNLDSSTFLGREVTDKMKDFTDKERSDLTMALASRLKDKYKVTLTYKVPEPPVEQVSVESSPSQGAAGSPVTIVMFSDFQCSACSGTHPLLKQAMAEYAGKIRFVVRNFPLESLHPQSMLAARAAAAANAQGKFFEFIEVLYKNQTALEEASLKKYAADAGLNAAQFEIDFNSAKTLAAIKKDIDDGESLNINSTPTIFVNGRRAELFSLDGFKAAIDRALKK